MKSIRAKARIKAGIRQIRLNWTFCCVWSNKVQLEMNPRGRRGDYGLILRSRLWVHTRDRVNPGPYDPTKARSQTPPVPPETQEAILELR